MNYRLNENKMTKTFEILNLTSRVVVKVFDKKDLALTYLAMINNHKRGIV